MKDKLMEKIEEIKKGVRIDLDNIIENLESYNEADNKMPYEDVLYTQINSYFQAVLTKVEAFLTSEVENVLWEVKEKIIGKDEINECYFENSDGSIIPDSGYNETIARNELRAEQRKALSDIGGGKLHLVEQKDESDKAHPYCGSKSLKATWSMEEFIGSEAKCQKCLDEYHKTSNYQLSGLQPKKNESI